MAEIRHIGCWRQNGKTRFSGKLSNYKIVAIVNEPIIGSLKSKMAKIRHLENRHDVIFFCRRWSDLDKISETGAEWHVDCGDVVEIETRYRILIWRTFGRIQSHVTHCRVLPLGEFTVTIPEQHATLQVAVSWQNQCHDRATLQGVRIPSAILKIVFRHILLFLFLMQFRLLTSGGFRIPWRHYLWWSFDSIHSKTVFAML